MDVDLLLPETRLAISELQVRDLGFTSFAVSAAVPRVYQRSL